MGMFVWQQALFCCSHDSQLQAKSSVLSSHLCQHFLICWDWCGFLDDVNTRIIFSGKIIIWQQALGIFHHCGVPAVLGDQSQSVESEAGYGEAEDSPGQDVSGMVLVVRHPGDGHHHGVHHTQHLHTQLCSVSMNQLQLKLKIAKELTIFQEVETFIF